MHLAFTPLAEQDLETIADYIATDNPARALSFVRELRAQCLWYGSGEWGIVRKDRRSIFPHSALL